MQGMKWVIPLVVVWVISQQAKRMYENWIMATVVIVGGVIGFFWGMFAVGKHFGLLGLVVYMPLVLFFDVKALPLLLKDLPREDE